MKSIVHPVYFYRDANGHEPVAEYITHLVTGRGIVCWCWRMLIQDAVGVLRRYGVPSRMPFVHHLYDNVWELKILCERILFVEYPQGTYVLLHGYNWKTCVNPHQEYMHTQSALEAVTHHDQFAA